MLSTAYSYMAMPWSRAKAKAAAIRADETGQMLADLNALFDACFRIQREATEAAGRHVPLVVENVRGAIPWVGRSKWNFGSYHLWGDVPALMPIAARRSGVKVPGMGAGWVHPSDPRHQPGLAFNPAAQGAAVREMLGTKNGGGSWFNVAHNTTSGVGMNPDGRKLPGFRFDGSGKSFQSAAVAEGVKGSDGYERDHPAAFGWKKPYTSSKCPARKAASARIAKIPEPLSRHIARVFKPRTEMEAA